MKGNQWIAFFAMTIVMTMAVGIVRADTFTVENTEPSGDKSLTWAVEQANGNENTPHTVNFAISTSEPVTIDITSPLVITRAGITIDGYSQSGATANTNPNGQALNTKLMISVSGENITKTETDIAVFHIKTGYTTIKGLNIHSGPAFAVAIDGIGNADVVVNTIQGCFIGTDITGSQALPNRASMCTDFPYSAGIAIIGETSYNYIGTEDPDSPAPEQRNLISGQVLEEIIDAGVLLFSDDAVLHTSYNLIAGNLIGTTADATGALANQHGIAFLGITLNNTVSGNVVSGNQEHGVYAYMPSDYVGDLNTGISISNNLIGVNPILGSALPNGLDGVHLGRGSISCAVGGLVGGTSSEDHRNIISGNGGHGVLIQGDETVDSSYHWVVSNYIGLSKDGLSALPNGADGVRVANTADHNDIGDVDLPNFISGNTGYGIALIGASNSVVLDNFIGTDKGEVNTLPNQMDGIAVLCTPEEVCCTYSTIEDNTINGNNGHGISIRGELHTGTTIGPNNNIKANLGSGVYGHLASLENSVQYNTITNNLVHGVELEGSSMEVSNNDILTNQGWGIILFPDYGIDTTLGTADDDTVAPADIFDNTINDNQDGGIICIDTKPYEVQGELQDRNDIDSGDKLKVIQVWYGAVEILDDAHDPITTGDYLVTLQNELGHIVQGDAPDGGLWGPGGWARSDVFSWFLLVDYMVTPDPDNPLLGERHSASTHTISATGPLSGTTTYTFDGEDNDGTSGHGQPEGILTDDMFRYQIAEVVVKADSDGDGVDDDTDCAPYNDQYPSPNPCDFDGDDYCNSDIISLVLETACPNDICHEGLCTPTDCDDTSETNHPGAVEESFGDLICDDDADNDCDGLTDELDPGCIECTIDENCDDGNLCNGEETCEAPVCQVTPVDCNDDNACTKDACDPDSGCYYIPFNGSCDDGLYCTVGESCQAGDCSGGVARDCSDLDDDCNIGVCNEDLDQCEAQPVDDDTTCDDENACTGSSSCQSGICTGPNTIICTALDQCHDVGTCDPGTGICSNPAKDDNTTCDDENSCTQTSSCQSGTCTGFDLITCTALDQCHEAGTCDPATGTCSNPAKDDGASCDDQDSCTKDDVCTSGVCAGTGECDPGGGDGDSGCGCAVHQPMDFSHLWLVFTALAWLVLRRRRS